MQAHLILKDVSIAITLVSKKLSVLSERINFEIKFFLNFLGRKKSEPSASMEGQDTQGLNTNYQPVT